jgi:hypothetical protein
VDARKNQHVTEHRSERARPQIAPVGQSFGAHDFDGVVVHAQLETIEGDRKCDIDQRLRPVLLELRLPHGELLLDVSLDRLDGLGGGENAGARKGFTNCMCRTPIDRAGATNLDLIKEGSVKALARDQRAHACTNASSSGSVITADRIASRMF